MQHSKQHYVPKSYLESWCDPDCPEQMEPYVWTFNEDGSSSKKKAPKNIFYEKDMYTIKGKDGERDLSIEHSLSSLEGAFTGIRDNKLAKRKILEPEEQLIVCAFIAAMKARSASHRDHWQNQWGNVLGKMEHMNEQFNKMPVEQRKKLTSLTPPRLPGDPAPMTMRDMRELSTSHLQINLMSEIGMMSHAFMSLDMAIFNTDGQPGFITSDDPCVFYDPEIHKLPRWMQTPHLGSATIEIGLPISPSQYILLNRQGINGHIDMQESLLAEELNKRTRFSAYKEFVVSQDVAKDEWFDTSIPPEESEDSGQTNETR